MISIKSGLGDDLLIRVLDDVSRGLIDADLGGGVIKQRVARADRGKSKGFRTIIVFRAGVRAIYVYGFGKNERNDIGPGGLIEFRRLASLLLGYDDNEIALATRLGDLIEVKDEQAV